MYVQNIETRLETSVCSNFYKHYIEVQKQHFEIIDFKKFMFDVKKIE